MNGGADVLTPRAGFYALQSHLQRYDLVASANSQSLEAHSNIISGARDWPLTIPPQPSHLRFRDVPSNVSRVL